MANENKENLDAFLNDYAGMGLESMNNSAVSTAYLSIVQPQSTVESAENPAGTWRNSATNENYGNVVKVVVLDFRTVWCEKDTSGMTIARYEPNSIPVTTQPVPVGQRGYPIMTNPATGNKIQELFLYAVMLPEHPEAGVLLFNPSVLSMRTCKTWNLRLRSSRLKNGKVAPIFAYTWNLGIDMIPNPKQPSKNVACLKSVDKGAIIDSTLFQQDVAPQLESVKGNVLAISSNAEPEQE